MTTPSKAAIARAVEMFESEIPDIDWSGDAVIVRILARHLDEVSEAVKNVFYCNSAGSYEEAGLANEALRKFILPKPVDPLVAIAREMTLLDGVVRTDSQKAQIRMGRAGQTASDDFYDRLRTALASRGGRIVFDGSESE